ncbi:MAG: hypothetical protein FK734_03135 [Asgard group archaeon]|nr:hypothetical protein [Asgard group archaeon]
MTILIGTIIFHHNGFVFSGLIAFSAFKPNAFYAIFNYLTKWYIASPIQIFISSSILLFFIELLIKTYRISKRITFIEKADSTKLKKELDASETSKESTTLSTSITDNNESD